VAAQDRQAVKAIPTRLRMRSASSDEPARRSGTLALAISSEEDDARIYRWFAQRLRTD
jgi:hypothetical protein